MYSLTAIRYSRAKLY